MTADLTPSEREADRNAAEFRAEIARTIWHTSRNDEGTISAMGADIVADALIAGPLAGLLAERDAALAQVAAVAALADKSRTHWHYEETWVVDQGDCVDLDDLLAALTDPATVLARRDAEKWDEGYSKGNLDGYFGTSDEKNPYRIEKGERG